jgi:hypothetical protein
MDAAGNGIVVVSVNDTMNGTPVILQRRLPVLVYPARRRIRCGRTEERKSVPRRRF